MNTLSVKLGIGRTLPKKGDAKAAKKRKKTAEEDTKKIPPEIKNKILERDDHTCRCCGFKSLKYQEILFLNHDKTDLREKNLATTCIFCHQCFYLDSVTEMRSGVLLWLPEVQQTQLHHIARAIYVARISQGPPAEASRKTLDAIMARRKEVQKRLQTDDPYILSMVLKDYLSNKQYASAIKKLEGVRLFPLDRRIIKEADLEFNQFPQILAYWRSKDGPFGGKIPQNWIPLYQKLAQST